MAEAENTVQRVSFAGENFHGFGAVRENIIREYCLVPRPEHALLSQVKEHTCTYACPRFDTWKW